MTIDRGQYGQIIISDIINGFLVTRQYYGYTRKEAKAIFNSDTK